MPAAIPAISTGAKPSLTLKRRLHASPQAVYAAWTDPQKLVRWFGPDRGPVTKAETDVRVGGRFHIVFHSEDGEEHDVSGVYRDVIQDQKLQFTWAWRTMPERESVVTIVVRPEGTGTLLTLIHEQLFDEATRNRHAYGWEGCFDKLEKFFAPA